MREGKNFTEKIADLITEIEFALQWKQAIILFAIYRSSHVLDDAEASLETKLKLRGQDLVRVRVRSDLSNVIDTIEKENQAKGVFSIADFSQGGGVDRADSYRLLNLHREYFIEEKIRAVFWLTKDEAQSLSAFAPDFWAFRHRIIDFVRNRATPERSASFQGLTWVEWPWHLFESDTKAALNYRIQLLEELSKEFEASVMRADLCGEIAGIYVQDKKYADAQAIIKQGLDNISELSVPQVEARLLIALAIVLIQMDAYEEAYVHLQKVVLLDEKTPLVFSLLAQTSRLAGRRTKALDFIKKELRLYPNSTFAWNECGNIYSDLGRTQDAISSYEKAFSIFPEQIIPALNRCAVLASANRLDEALNFLGKIDLSQAIDLDKVKNTQGFEFLNIEAFL